LAWAEPAVNAIPATATLLDSKAPAMIRLHALVVFIRVSAHGTISTSIRDGCCNFRHVSFIHRTL
jgi:hypothetical protein